MWYEINVSQKCEHLFATHERSIKSAEELRRVYGEIKSRFPAEQGFEITVTRFDALGHRVNTDLLDAEPPA